MKKRLILATNNNNKVKEIKAIFSNIDIDIFSLRDLLIEVAPEENGKTFDENAYIKAKAVYDYMISNNIYLETDIIIADDSGFCIDYLNGEPGILSSRYLGENVTYGKKFQYILDKMKKVKWNDRSCHFETCICMIKNNIELYFRGSLDGKVSLDIKGSDGFGYDPIFYIEEYKDTIASIGQEIKNKISHRRKALDKLYLYLKNEI